MARELKFWYVRHPFSWYKEHPDIIDLIKSRAERNRNFRNVAKEDKIIYYSHEEPKGLVGLFQVVSSKPINRRFDGEDYSCYKIKPLFIPNGDQWPLKFSPKRDLGLSLKPMGTIFELKPDQYEKIKMFLLGMGEPSNHEGVVALFSKIHKYIGYPIIEQIQQEYPDAVVRDSHGKQKRVEFEFDSIDFRDKHDIKDCDVIVCWRDSWRSYAPKRLKIVELQGYYGSGSKLVKN